MYSIRADLESFARYGTVESMRVNVPPRVMEFVSLFIEYHPTFTIEELKEALELKFLKAGDITNDNGEHHRLREEYRKFSK